MHIRRMVSCLCSMNCRSSVVKRMIPGSMLGVDHLFLFIMSIGGQSLIGCRLKSPWHFSHCGHLVSSDIAQILPRDQLYLLSRGTCALCCSLHCGLIPCRPQKLVLSTVPSPRAGDIPIVHPIDPTCSRISKNNVDQLWRSRGPQTYRKPAEPGKAGKERLCQLNQERCFSLRCIHLRFKGGVPLSSPPATSKTITARTCREATPSTAQLHLCS